ncbi:MAG TPA: hypothetical protein VND64_04015 [Pirellulales bacterium]|nr:hypothetical protein [Pirellulales bacterium]
MSWVGIPGIRAVRQSGPAGWRALDLEELSAAKVHEFAFNYAPLWLKGATGSPDVAPTTHEAPPGREEGKLA